jgi:hypothetical protein
LSVKSRQVPAAPGKRGQCVGQLVDRISQRSDLAFSIECQLALQVAIRYRCHDPRDTAHLVGQVIGHRVDIVGQVFPDAGHAPHLRLAA